MPTDTEELPIPTTKEAKQGARSQGRKAYEERKEIADCPYTKREQELRSSWILGWVEGKMNRQKLLRLIR